MDRVIRFRLWLFLVFTTVFVAAMAASAALVLAGRAGFPVVATSWLGAMAVILAGHWLLQRVEGPLQDRLREADFKLCPTCGYPAAGRPEEACPECGDRTPVEEIRGVWKARLGAWWPKEFK